MTTTNIYIASPEGANGRNVVAYGVLKALTTKFKTTGSLGASNHDHYHLVNASNAGLGVALSTGLDIHQVRKDKEGSRGDIVAAFNDAMNVSRADAALIVGTDKSHVNDPTAYEFNANIAADLQAGVFLAVCTIDRWPDELKDTVRLSIEGMEAAGNKVLGIFVTGCEPRHSVVKDTLADFGLPVWTIPQIPFTEVTGRCGARRLPGERADRRGPAGHQRRDRLPDHLVRLPVQPARPCQGEQENDRAARRRRGPHHQGGD